MAVAGGPAGPVLARPVFAFKTVHAQLINNKHKPIIIIPITSAVHAVHVCTCMQRAERVTAIAINTSMHETCNINLVTIGMSTPTSVPSVQDIPDKPHQPSANYKFPKQTFVTSYSVDCKAK